MVTQVLAAREERQALAVLVVDLDNFKRINDSLGHRSGDLALQQAAQRIRAVLGQHDMLARFSGDEFCVPPWAPGSMPRRPPSGSSTSCARRSCWATPNCA